MKNFTLLSALLVAGMATAQVEMTAPNMEARQVITTQTVEMDREVTMEEWNAEYIAKQQKAAAADYAAHDYYFVEGMMHGGVTPQFYGVMPLIMLPFTPEIEWTNLYGPTSWYSQATDALLAENSETLTMTAWEDYGLDGMYYLMYTTDHALTQNGQTYNIKGYFYGESARKKGAAFATGSAPIGISTGENIPMTLCGMETSMMNNDSGSDFYRISAGDRGAYAYGTNLIADLATGKTADTIISTVRNVSPLKISSVSIPVYNSNGTTIMPETGEVKIEIIAADLTTGKIYTDSILGTAIATAADFVDVQAGLGTIVGRFYEEDPFGGMMEVAVVVEGDFVTRVTGYNETGCDFGIYADYYTPGSTTVYQVNGKYTPIFNASSNLAIGYDAYWPMLECGMGSEILVAPVAGGVAMDGEYQAFALYTNVYDVEGAWIISDETSEWLEFALDASTLETEGYIVAQITAEALPAGMTGRKGAVVIDADGYKLSIPVLQGEATGVENVVTPSIKDNKRYNLLGVEVDENYNGVVIMNGQKFIQ
jgi:hypothetical protein